MFDALTFLSGVMVKIGDWSVGFCGEGKEVKCRDVPCPELPSAR